MKTKPVDLHRHVLQFVEQDQEFPDGLASQLGVPVATLTLALLAINQTLRRIDKRLLRIALAVERIAPAGPTDRVGLTVTVVPKGEGPPMTAVPPVSTDLRNDLLLASSPTASGAPSGASVAYTFSGPDTVLSIVPIDATRAKAVLASPGSGTITATASDSGVSDTCDVTVTAVTQPGTDAVNLVVSVVAKGSI